MILLAIWNPKQKIRTRIGWTLLAVSLAFLAWFLLHQDQQRSPRARDTVDFPQGEEAYYDGRYDAAIESFLKSIEREPDDPRPYYRLVDSYHRIDKLDEVEPVFLSLLSERPDNACAYYGLGCLEVHRQDLETALEQAMKAVEIDPHFGYARLLLGSVHNYAGRPMEALEAWRKAQEIFHSEGNRMDESWALNRMALIHRQIGDLTKAREGFEYALAIQRDEGDRPAQMVVLGNLALTQTDLGDLEKSTSCLQEALSISREVGDLWNECWILTNLSYVDLLVGRYHDALTLADTAITIAREIGDPIEEVSGLLNRALAIADLGDPIGALEVCKRALTLSDSIADVRHRAGVLLVMGDAYLGLGLLDRSRDAFSLSDSLYRSIDLETGSGTALAGICEVAIQEGDTAHAIGEAIRTMERFEQSGYAEGEESIALMLAEITLRSGDAESSLDYATRAVDLSTRDGRRSREALARARRSVARGLMGDQLGAEEDARAACRLGKACRSPEIIWICEMALGDVLRSKENKENIEHEEVLAHYYQAMDAVETVQRRLRIDEFKAGYLENKVELYFKAADLLCEMEHPAGGFSVCERSRGRALSDMLSQSPHLFKPQVPEPLARRDQELEAQFKIQRATLTQLAASGEADTKRLKDLEKEYEKTKRAREDLRARILLEDPEFEWISGHAAPPDPEQILAALDEDEILLEYFLGDGYSYCFVAGNGRIEAIKLDIDRAELSLEIDQLRRPLSSPRSLTTLSFNHSLSKSLRERIFDPVEPFIGEARRLLIIPDGPLHYLPFELLATSMPLSVSSDTLYSSYRSGGFLCDHYTIRYSPSAAFLLMPEKPGSGSRADPDQRGLLIFGTPVFEIEAIARLFPDATVLAGDEATEAAFKTLAPQFRSLHVSSHGEVDEKRPLYSGLALAGGRSGEETGGEDGFIHAYEIMELPLSCELVTLSACGTAMGRIYAGEGLLGLTRAFLYAGARQEVVSLWNVDDTSTALFMEIFYKNLASGLDAGLALQETKKELRGKQTMNIDGCRIACAHPFFWAPFILISGS